MLRSGYLGFGGALHGSSESLFHPSTRAADKVAVVNTRRCHDRKKSRAVLVLAVFGAWDFLASVEVVYDWGRDFVFSLSALASASSRCVDFSAEFSGCVRDRTEQMLHNLSQPLFN